MCPACRDRMLHRSNTSARTRSESFPPLRWARLISRTVFSLTIQLLHAFGGDVRRAIPRVETD